MCLREASQDDAAACAAIYEPYVTETTISFETTPPSSTEMAERIATAHHWLVAELDERVVGYAYATEFKSRPAYSWACEVSVYLEQGRRRTGAGKALYGRLLPELAERGFHIAVAGLTMPNEASAGLHEAMGFELVGVFSRIGWKFGAWHDLAQYQRSLQS